MSPTDVAIEVEDRGPPARKDPSRLRQVAGLTVFVCVSAVFVVSIFRSNQSRQKAEAMIRKHEANVQQLRQEITRLRSAREQSDRDRLVVFDLLRQCRVAEDIPDFTGEMVWFQHRGSEGFTLWVPEGKHRLKIDAWVSKVNASGVNPPDQVERIGEISHTIELLPSTGYSLEMQSERGGTPVTWTLSANNQEFETRTETVPVEGFKSLGWSYSNSNLAAYPNEVQHTYRIDDLQKAARDPPGLRLYDLKLNGKSEENSLQVEIRASLLTDGPARVRASIAQSVLIRQQGDLLQPYRGGGYYDLKVVPLD